MSWYSLVTDIEHIPCSLGKTVVYEEEEHVFGPFSLFRRTERPDRTGTNKVLLDGD